MQVCVFAFDLIFLNGKVSVFCVVERERLLNEDIHLSLLYSYSHLLESHSK